MKDKKLEEAIDYVCSCCPYIFSGSAEWNKSNPAFAGWRDSATKYCDRCMVRKMTSFIKFFIRFCGVFHCLPSFIMSSAVRIAC